MSRFDRKVRRSDRSKAARQRLWDEWWDKVDGDDRRRVTTDLFGIFAFFGESLKEWDETRKLRNAPVDEFAEGAIKWLEAKISLEVWAGHSPPASFAPYLRRQRMAEELQKDAA